jgi:hypothetical protein
MHEATPQEEMLKKKDGPEKLLKTKGKKRPEEGGPDKSMKTKSLSK